MQDFRKRRIGKQDFFRVVRGIGGILILAVVATFAVRGAWGMYQKFAAASQADQEAGQELGDLKAQQQKVSAAVASLGSERGQEAGLRERYGVAQPQEGEIDIVRRAGTTTQESTTEPNIFDRIFRAVFVW